MKTLIRVWNEVCPLYRFHSISYTTKALLREYVFAWNGVHSWIVPSQRTILMQFMLDVVVFVINKYKDGKKPWGSLKATWEHAQHQLLFALRVLAKLLRQWVKINSKFNSLFLICFSVEHPSVPILPILHLSLKCSAACCAPHSHGSFAVTWIQAEGMVCAHKT